MAIILNLFHEWPLCACSYLFWYCFFFLPVSRLKCWLVFHRNSTRSQNFNLYFVSSFFRCRHQCGIWCDAFCACSALFLHQWDSHYYEYYSILYQNRTEWNGRPHVSSSASFINSILLGQSWINNILWEHM